MSIHSHSHSHSLTHQTLPNAPKVTLDQAEQLPLDQIQGEQPEEKEAESPQILQDFEGQAEQSPCLENVQEPSRLNVQVSVQGDAEPSQVDHHQGHDAHPSQADHHHDQESSHRDAPDQADHHPIITSQQDSNISSSITNPELAIQSTTKQVACLRLVKFHALNNIVQNLSPNPPGTAPPNDDLDQARDREN
jgi:hypothetical protein